MQSEKRVLLKTLAPSPPSTIFPLCRGNNFILANCYGAYTYDSKHKLTLQLLDFYVGFSFLPHFFLIYTLFTPSIFLVQITILVNFLFTLVIIPKLH